MTVEIVAKLAASSSLNDINRTVEQEERRIGPLINIGNDKGKTTLTFALGAKPTAYAVISEDVGGTPSIPAGATVIDTDMILIEGVSKLCTAARPA